MAPHKQRKGNYKAKADVNQIADLALNKDLSCRQIAAVTGVGKTRVAEIIQQVKTSKDFADFQDNKDKVFENLQYRLINLADDNILKTMLGKRGFTDAAILQDKIQLLRGQATEVTGVQIRVILDNLPSQMIDVTPNTCSKAGPEIELETTNIIRQLETGNAKIPPKIPPK